MDPRFGLEQPPISRDLLACLPTPRRIPLHDNGRAFVGSGKAALELILLYLRQAGVLSSKTSEVIVPKWLGSWVYAQILNHAFPVTVLNTEAAAVLCYHQYGFPQNMERVLEIARDRELVVIEDCAHAAESFYKGRQLGSFGDFSLFSLSKFTFCYALGAVVANENPEFTVFLEDRMRGRSRVLRSAINAFKFLDESNASRSMPSSWYHGIRKMAYSRYGDQVLASRAAIKLWVDKKDEELSARRSNYQLLRNSVSHLGLCDHLEDQGVAPYAVPLVVPDSKIDRVVAGLASVGVRAGLYQFDFNRCVFEPYFKTTVLVPIHSGMQGAGMERMIGSLVRTL